MQGEQIHVGLKLRGRFKKGSWEGTRLIGALVDLHENESDPSMRHQHFSAGSWETRLMVPLFADLSELAIILYM
jgi:hypothetical protein